MMFPELNVRVNDLSHPTEAFLTRVLIHCLRAFGFRIEPPYNIESESTDPSKEKRVFLCKLCRQVQHILQISFPGKTYTYHDIIEPSKNQLITSSCIVFKSLTLLAVKKTLNTLDVLFNYWCFYKMHKKQIIPPIMEKHIERQALIADIAAKRRELEQIKSKKFRIRLILPNAKSTYESCVKNCQKQRQS